MGAGHPHFADRLVGRLTRRARLFSDGWGDERVIAAFASPPFTGRPIEIAPAWDSPSEKGVVEGSFLSPIDRLPPEVRTGRVRWIRAAPPRRAAILCLTSAGDETFWLRHRLFGPLAKEGVDVFLLENPYYGRRRPNGQRGSQIRTVAEHALMNFATIEEARGLLAWMRAAGWSQLGLVGYSMGGFVAAAAAAVTVEPLAVAVLAAGASPALVLTGGFVSNAIDFAALGGAPDRADDARRRLAELFDKTDLSRFPPLPRPEAAVLVACTRDGFVPTPVVEALHAHWPGSELRRISAGHVSAVFMHARALRAAVRDALARLG